MLKNHKVKILLLMLVFASVLFGGIAVFAAWNNPTASPPANNTEAPINVGATAQTKTGNLTVNNLYLTATSEGNLSNINQITGFNDLLLYGNSTKNAPIYLEGSSVIINNDAGTGNVGIGTTDPSAGKLVVNGLIVSQNNGAAYLKGGDDATLNDVNIANTVGIVGVQDATKGCIQLGNSTATYICGITGGNLGIGTTNPGAKLDVVGTMKMTGFQLGASTIAGYVLTANSSGVGTWQAATGGGGSSISAGDSNVTVTDTGDGYITFTEDASEKMRITGGNVGIGTTGPGAKLDVAGNIEIGAGDAVSDQIISNYNPNNTINFASNGVTYSSYLSHIFQLDKDANDTTEAFIVNTNNAATELFRITAAGNIGIGTTSPGNKLVLISSRSDSPTDIAAFASTLYVFGTPVTVRTDDLRVYDDATSGNITNLQGRYAEINVRNAGTVSIVKNLSTWGRLSGAGNVGDWIHYEIAGVSDTGSGTITNQYGLKIGDLTAATNNWSIYTGSAPSYFGGNVGIGTTGPGAKLDVAGTSRIYSGSTGTHQSYSTLSLVQTDNPVLVMEDVGNNVGYLAVNNGNDVILGAERNIAFKTGVSFASGPHASGTTRMYIDTTSGNIGIGTTNPGAKLEAVDTKIGNISGAIVEGRQNGGFATLTLRGRDGDAPTVALPPNQGPGLSFQGFDGSSFGNMARIGAFSKSTLSTSNHGGYLKFFTIADGTTLLNERMRIDHNGNVGIGTTSPGAKLEVNGGVKLNTSDSRPTCDSSQRGTMWFRKDDTAGDNLAVCYRLNTGSYAWRMVWLDTQTECCTAAEGSSCTVTCKSGRRISALKVFKYYYSNNDCGCGLTACGYDCLPQPSCIGQTSCSFTFNDANCGVDTSSYGYIGRMDVICE